jgi:hypothetical protein
MSKFLFWMWLVEMRSTEGNRQQLKSVASWLLIGIGLAVLFPNIIGALPKREPNSSWNWERQIWQIERDWARGEKTSKLEQNFAKLSPILDKEKQNAKILKAAIKSNGNLNTIKPQFIGNAEALKKIDCLIDLREQAVRFRILRDSQSCFRN